MSQGGLSLYLGAARRIDKAPLNSVKRRRSLHSSVAETMLVELIPSHLFPDHKGFSVSCVDAGCSIVSHKFR
jgi:hypothetical protein